MRKEIALLGSFAFAALLGCGGAAAQAGAGPGPSPEPSPAAPSKPAAHEPAAKETVDTGNPCVKAEVQCEGGACVLAIKNDCDQAVSCDATMTTTCKSPTDMIEAARRKRETYPAKSDGELRLVGDCTTGEIMRTAMKSLACK